MANPQSEDGHTDIANEIMDALARTRIPGEARQILDFILRKTYGWHKKEDSIALSQFVKGTGLSKVAVCKATSKLIEMNLITKKGNVTQKGNEWCSTYCFNKDFQSWKPLPKKVTLPKKVMSITEKGKESLPKKVPTKNQNSTKETTKEKGGAKTSAFVLPEWIDPSAWTGFEEMRRKIKKPMTDRARANIVTKLAAFKAKGHDPTKILDKSITNSWQDVYEPKQETIGHDRKSFDQIERERQERIREESRRKIGMGGTGLVPSRSNQPSSLGIGGSQGALPGTDSETAAIEDQADG